MHRILAVAVSLHKKYLFPFGNYWLELPLISFNAPVRTSVQNIFLLLCFMLSTQNVYIEKSQFYFFLIILRDFFQIFMEMASFYRKGSVCCIIYKYVNLCNSVSS